MDSRIILYSILGIISTLLLSILILFNYRTGIFITSGFTYFSLGLFLGWRIESKRLLAFVLIFIPLIILTAIAGSTIITHIFLISVILFFDGFLISKFGKYGLIKLAIVMLTVGVCGYIYSIY